MINTIKALFPNALINAQEIEKLVFSHYIFNVEQDTVAIEKSSLSETEQALLQLLINKDKKDLNPGPSHSIWQNFLERKSNNIPVVSGNIQFLHLDFRTQPKQFDSALWFDTLKEAVPNIIEWFDIDERRFTLIIRIKKNEELVAQELSGIIQTLDVDFDTVSRSILGYTHVLSMNLPARYEEELKVVNHSLQLDYLDPFTTLSPLLLKHLGKQIIPSEPLLAPLKQTITSNSEYVALIRELFFNQGNLSQTAEQLYIHRNTLTYRLQKFYRETGMQLQFLPDLIICYLCLP